LSRGEPSPCGSVEVQEGNLRLAARLRFKDQKDVFNDEYTAYVMYTIPKTELNRQVARALETSVKKDSALYDITIQMAKDILQSGMANWGN